MTPPSTELFFSCSFGDFSGEVSHTQERRWYNAHLLSTSFNLKGTFSTTQNVQNATVRHLAVSRFEFETKTKKEITC